MFVLGMAGPHWPSESHRFFLIFCFLIHQRQLALTCLSANPLMLFLFMPRRPTSSTGFPEETPTKLPGASVSCSHRPSSCCLTTSSSSDFLRPVPRSLVPPVDIYYPTSILRPVYYYTVPSSARSGVRGTQRPANIVYSTVPY